MICLNFGGSGCFCPARRTSSGRNLSTSEGFRMLKESGLAGVNIDKLTDKTFIAKGTFYNFFENKSEYMYHMMIHERNRSKEKLISYLNNKGKLTKDSLKAYLLWLSSENPNVFAYLTDAEKKRLVVSWSDRYIEDEENDSKTMHTLISLLDKPHLRSLWSFNFSGIYDETAASGLFD